MGAIPVRVPRVVRFHFDEHKAQYKVVVTTLDEQSGNNQVREFISWFLTLAEVLIFIVDVLASHSPTYTATSGPIGQMSDLAAYVTANAVNGTP